ncbi:MAG TPA: response regulator transcription factor [Actinomycetota bacterium]|jgi:two-component system nitrate/nitrite response regulator NarL|nr:response regulator transcription factor [Actinomycetota bacterium]
MTDGGGRSIRVLLADQHALFREALRTVLEREPDLEVVAEAGNGMDALSQVERVLPHVAILDVDLPMSNGPRTASLVKERAPDCRVIVLSPQEDYRRLIEALDAGASGYLTKEAPLEDLIHATRAVHRGETLVPPRMLGPLLTSLLRRKSELDHRHQRISRLTPREREVLALLANGAENDTIARTLVISRQTARTHIQNILGKLEVHSRLEAVAFVRGSGMLEDLVDLTQNGSGEQLSVIRS